MAPKYKDKYEAALQDLIDARRDKLALSQVAAFWRLVSVGAAIFALLCLALVYRATA